MKDLLSKVFIWMFLGLLVTFFTGFVISSNPNMIENIFGGFNYIIFIIVELVLVIFLSAKVFSLSPVMAKVSFLLYSFVSGLTFSSIMIAYNVQNIIYIFLATSVIFACMALYGYSTKRDLTKFGSYFFFGILAVIVVSLINIFIGSSTLEIILSIVFVILFLGVTAYDIQKLKELDGTDIPKENLAVYGALELYLDFINIFVQLIYLFGNNSDN